MQVEQMIFRFCLRYYIKGKHSRLLSIEYNVISFDCCNLKLYKRIRTWIKNLLSKVSFWKADFSIEDLVSSISLRTSPGLFLPIPDNGENDFLLLCYLTSITSILFY